jgi:hypothetical protein
VSYFTALLWTVGGAGVLLGVGFGLWAFYDWLDVDDPTAATGFTVVAAACVAGFAALIQSIANSGPS